MGRRVRVWAAAFAAIGLTAAAALTTGTASAAPREHDPTCSSPEEATVTGTTGTNGPDVIYGTPGNDVIDAGNGKDFVCGLGGNDTIIGGNGKDQLLGGLGNDTISGGEGNDEILGGDFSEGGGPFGPTDGNDTLDGGAGNDFITGQRGTDTVNGGVGDDELFGGPGNDTVSGGDGDDFLAGLFGSDTLNGGAGDDTINGDIFGEEGFAEDPNANTDTCDGGDGFDAAAYCEVPSSIEADITPT